jgi:hypothetical protein
MIHQNQNNNKPYALELNDEWYIANVTRDQAIGYVRQTRAAPPDDVPYHCGERMQMSNGKYKCVVCKREF